MRTSPIDHPPDSRFLALRAHYVTLCDDPAAAMLLSVFEGWTIIKRYKDPDAEPEDVWLRLTKRQLEDQVFGLFKRTVIERALERLVWLGFLERRDSDGTDRSKLYRLDVDALNTAIVANDASSGRNQPLEPTESTALARASDVGLKRTVNRTPTVAEAATELGTAVHDVWAYWCQRRKPRRTDLEPSQARLIAKALNVGFDTAELKRAIDGLFASEWHREHRKLQLSTILATRPGGPTLRDQVEGFIERLEEPSSPAGPARSPLTQGRIEAVKHNVRMKWGRELRGDELESFERDLEFLAGHGITAQVGPHPDTPRFEERPS